MKYKKRKSHADGSLSDSYFLLPYTKITKSPEDNSSSLPVNNSYIADSELSEERHRFNSTRNAYSALSIFIKCIDYGYYPPFEVLKFISDGFKEHINDNKPIASVLGLTKSNKNSYEISKRDINIVLEIDSLRHYFKLKKEDAVYAVARRYEEIGVKLKDTSIADKYHRDGKNELDRSLQYSHDDIPLLDEMSEEYQNEWKMNFLNRYPTDVKEFILKMAR